MQLQVKDAAFTDENAVYPAISAGEGVCKGRPYRTENGFRNLHAHRGSGFVDFLKWRWERLGKTIPSPRAYNFPLGKNDPEFLRSNGTRNTVTWIGHATIFMQIKGLNILTDPQFSLRASPFQWVGPKRVEPPGLNLEDLPEIHMVVISHDHYDSLDKDSIKRIRDRDHREVTRFFVPLGLKSWFNDLGIRNVRELGWCESTRFRDAQVIAVPTQHWSQRGFSRNKTLWAGWIIMSKGFRLFFVGDSGYTEEFLEIGREYGPFDLAAIPIGAYEPRWFMRGHHMTPEEAVKVHLDVRAKKSLGIHWGTFMLTDEPLDEPPRRLETAKREREIDDGDFVVVKHGETLLL